MPLYEYECKACGERTEALQAFSDPPLTVCPACGGVLVKLLSPPAIQFKGSGFYLTDYGKSGSAAKTTDKSTDAGGGSAAAPASGGGEAAGSGASDSSKGKKGEGAAGAAPPSPAAPPPSSPSKEKTSDKK